MVRPTRTSDLEELEVGFYRRNSWPDGLYMGVLYDSVPHTIPPETDTDFKPKYLAEPMPLSRYEVKPPKKAWRKSLTRSTRIGTSRCRSSLSLSVSARSLSGARHSFITSQAISFYVYRILRFMLTHSSKQPLESVESVPINFRRWRKPCRNRTSSCPDSARTAATCISIPLKLLTENRASGSL